MQLPREQLEQAEARLDHLIEQLGTREVASDPDRLREIGQEQAELQPVVDVWRALLECERSCDEARALLSDEDEPEMRDYLQAEVHRLEADIEQRRATLAELLLTKDPHDDRDVIVEVRAGTGGDEAALFAADLFRMYSRFAESLGWKVDVLSRSEIGLGGLKEIIFEVRGRGAFSKLKWESGVHRVQRVPETEASGRIHTSTATVAVLPEMDEVEVQIPETDIRVDVFRSSGPGGQSVNTTDSAVRITHVPSGIVITCQDEKSQHQNRRKALQVLRARLNQLELDRQLAERGEARRSMVGSGERSEKIRTYNFPQSRITDHRIGFTTHRLTEVLAGGLGELAERLSEADRAERLEQVEAGGPLAAETG